MNSTTRQPRRSRPETLARRERILEAAMTTFGARGYNKGPLTEIAEQVGMTHAGVLHHFGSKDQLLLEVLRYRDESDVKDLEGQHIPGGIELFRHLVRTALLNARRAGLVQAYVVLSAESVTEGHPARDWFVERYRTLRREVGEAFRAVCAERGIDEPATVDRAAASILAVMDGLQVQWLLDPEQVDLAESSAFAIEAIVAQVLDPREAL
ncbi:TetR/AcrR family transcriptional regulator [Myceligenerans pegani]|uniref:TetR/AcrR family transcriptional regulator n=1 Tax=Myceligenerans pegani TaxID=2776917 RepID=A0ABR9N0D7_9MICO|nr:TetR/AcrR family transcriptional regulator [Myceligenerans sp. TRM 65318]MBE1876746.1 TetR/AcrR family transcriptional regulator [Myceligenerans sp. TRM 65318]MBE3019017.1 TetR/AcrR family transcriptional regulator [Myceligenerans sp. TRM 65318]